MTQKKLVIKVQEISHKSARKLQAFLKMLVILDKPLLNIHIFHDLPRIF